MLVCIEIARGIAMRMMRPVLAVSVSAFCLLAFTHYNGFVHAQNQAASHPAALKTLVVPIKTSSGQDAGSAAFKESKDGKQLTIPLASTPSTSTRTRCATRPTSRLLAGTSIPTASSTA
jgi:hypothetical protein